MPHRTIGSQSSSFDILATPIELGVPGAEMNDMPFSRGHFFEYCPVGTSRTGR